jgi:hypothetical protein
MARRSQATPKVVRSTLENQDVIDLFQNIMGTGEESRLNLAIVYPKYLAIENHCDRFQRLLRALAQSETLARFGGGVAEALNAYIEYLNMSHMRTFAAVDLAARYPDEVARAAAADPDEGAAAAAPPPVDYERVPADEQAAFAEVYGGVKNSEIVSKIIVTCKNLITHKHALQDSSRLDDRFLARSAGLTFAPIADVPAFNAKQIYMSDTMRVTDRQFLLLVLHKMMRISHDVYDAVSSPDIDVNEFVEIVAASLDDVKKHIPRCDQAFNKIRESVEMLKDNFGNYYKDYVASNNPSIIMENFVLDVSDRTEASPQVRAQFRRIIAYYRKAAGQHAQHPKLRTLFQQVDKNFQVLERSSRRPA